MTQLIPQLETIQTGLQAFETRKETVKQMVLNAASLVQITNKQEYKAVDEKRKELKAERNAIEKEGKLLRDPVNALAADILVKERELTTEISPEEKRLQGLQDEWDKEQDRIKQEQINAENRRIQSMIDHLAEYSFALPHETLCTISVEDFNMTLAHAKSEWDKEQADLKAKEEKAQLLNKRISTLQSTGFLFNGTTYSVSENVFVVAEDIANISEEDFADHIQSGKDELKRIADEKQAFQDQQDALKKQQDDLKKQQDELGSEKKRIKDDRSKGRAAELLALGLVRLENSFEGYGITVNFHSVTDGDNDTWVNFIADVAPKIEAAKLKEKQDKEAEDRQKQEDADEKARKKLADEQEQARIDKIEADAALSDKDRFAALVSNIQILLETQSFKSTQYKSKFNKLTTAINSSF